MTDYDKLRELAQHATPGPWEAGNGIVYDIPEDDLHRFDIMPTTIATAGETCADAEFIAAANPEVVLALLDRIAELVAKDE